MAKSVVGLYITMDVTDTATGAGVEICFHGFWACWTTSDLCIPMEGLVRDDHVG